MATIPGRAGIGSRAEERLVDTFGDGLVAGLQCGDPAGDLPGDVVECTAADAQVAVNGELLTEDYIAPGARPCGVEFRVEVPEGYIWVMGDNRDDSADSRAHMGDPGGGTVPVDNIVGTTFAVVWPLDRFAGVGNPFGDEAASTAD